MSRLSARHGSTNTGREVAPTRDERTIDWLTEARLKEEIDKLAQEILDGNCPPNCPLCNLVEDFEKGWSEGATSEGELGCEALHGEDPQAAQDVAGYRKFQRQLRRKHK